MFSALQFGNDDVRSKKIIVSSFVIPPAYCSRCDRAYLVTLTAVIIKARDRGFDVNPLAHVLVDTFHDVFLHRAEGADFGDAVPGIGRAGFATDGFVALEEARHEEFARHGGEFDAAPF